MLLNHWIAPAAAGTGEITTAPWLTATRTGGTDGQRRDGSRVAVGDHFTANADLSEAERRELGRTLALLRQRDNGAEPPGIGRTRVWGTHG